MDSTIPEGAPKNPFHDYVYDYATVTRNFHPSEYIRPGAYQWIRIPQQMKIKISDSLLNLQKLLLPTIRGLRNERNVSQLQNKVYRKIKVYEQEYNTCHLACRNQSQVYQCGDTLLHRLNVQMPEHIKKVLQDY